VFVPTNKETRRLTGRCAAEFLAGLLHKLNGADCIGVSIRAAVLEVARAERKARRRAQRMAQQAHKRRRTREAPPLVRLSAWEWLLADAPYRYLSEVSPLHRLALEMAVTEELERGKLESDAESASVEWNDQEQIAAIADDLLVPEAILYRIEQAKSERKPNP
jgi:hypothetical protein